MSLLLDALKRAEEAKRAKLSVDAGADSEGSKASSPAIPVGKATDLPARARTETANTEAAEFRLEDYKEVIPARTGMRHPATAKPPAGEPLRSTELSLESISDDSAVDSAADRNAHAMATTAPPPLQSKLDKTRVDAAQSRDSARNVFVAKTVGSPDDGSRKAWLLPVIAVVLLAVGGGGWYVWNEVNRTSRPTAPNLAARPSPAAALAPVQPATGQPGARQPVDAAAQSAAPVELPLPPLLPPPAEQTPLPKLALRTPANAGPPLSERELLAKSLKDAPTTKEAPVELKLARSIDAPAVNADLAEAYAALRSADYQRARGLYAKLVLAEPLNPDAQLGMATVLARGGDSTSAARYYRQVLVIDPRNGAALAGLLAVSDTRSPSLEVELRTLVDRNPETSALRFALGNLYATERRWLEAQQAYFEAYRLEADNADYLYNLAVSLDQLKQPKLAIDYYQKSLSARSKGGGQFDPATVARRIKELTAEPRIN